ncbi:3'-5' exonuclease [Candidatus Pacearchaeota archaeon]|nr:3'-5' exonuclease [Candidatus Pacearchaeota archaeon]
MIVVDIETSGPFDPKKYGIWQIGAVEFNNPKNIFLEEARIDDEDEIAEEALKIIGKTEEQLRDSEKQSQNQLIKNFFEWTSKIKNKIMIAHNTPFDYGFLTAKAIKYSLENPMNRRTLDIHAIAFQKYFQINNSFPIEEGKSTMNLPKVQEFCGLEEKRIQLKEGKVIKEGTPHNALEDAKLEAECLSRILYGKSLFKEFEQFPIPENLIRSNI